MSNEDILFDKRYEYDTNKVIDDDIEGGITFDTVLGCCVLVIFGIALLA